MLRVKPDEVAKMLEDRRIGHTHHVGVASWTLQPPIVVFELVGRKIKGTGYVVCALNQGGQLNISLQGAIDHSETARFFNLLDEQSGQDPGFDRLRQNWHRLGFDNCNDLIAAVLIEFMRTRALVLKP